MQTEKTLSLIAKVRYSAATNHSPSRRSRPFMSQARTIDLRGDIKVDTQGDVCDIIPHVKKHVTDIFRLNFHTLEGVDRLEDWTFEMSKDVKMLEVIVQAIEVNGVPYSF